VLPSFVLFYFVFLLSGGGGRGHHELELKFKSKIRLELKLGLSMGERMDLSSSSSLVIFKTSMTHLPSLPPIKQLLTPRVVQQGGMMDLSLNLNPSFFLFLSFFL
jgi:hypothetical protein